MRHHDSHTLVLETGLPAGEWAQETEMTDLTPHLRQYMHNDGSGFVAGYDCDGIERVVAGLDADIERLRCVVENAAVNNGDENNNILAADAYFEIGELLNVGEGGSVIAVVDQLKQERDQLKAALHAVIDAASKLSFGLVEDDVNGNESEFTRNWFARLQDAITAAPKQRLAAHDAEVIERAMDAAFTECDASGTDSAEEYHAALCRYMELVRTGAEEVKS